jgi:hypothetical protein
MITVVFFIPNASGLVRAKNLRKWAEKAFASSTLVFHGLVDTCGSADFMPCVEHPAGGLDKSRIFWLSAKNSSFL